MDQIVPESDYSLRVCITFFFLIYLFLYFGNWRVYVFVLMLFIILEKCWLGLRRNVRIWMLGQYVNINFEN